MADVSNLFTGVAIVALTGLTYLAYRHPDGYFKLCTPIQLIICLALFLGAAWDAGRSQAYIDFLPLLLEAQGSDLANPLIKKADIILDEGDLLNWTLIIIAIGLSIYLQFLRYLPLLTAGDDHNK